MAHRPLLKYLVVSLLTMCYVLLTAPSVLAIYDPRTVDNNKVGIHILSPSELESARDLVNSNGGDWGYVTVPIQPADRNIEVWQKFMHQAKEFHLIPIIRITTVPNGGTWDSAAATDLVDFANFLSELDWPVENRYIILFNEVNQSREWGGVVDPIKYTEIVKNARTIFKERSEDFFLLGPALDDALPDSTTSMSAKRYLASMYSHDNAVWSYFDGLAVHAYSNPGFAQPPRKNTYPGINSYNYLFTQYKLADKPVFVTETGWDQSRVNGAKLQSYWETAWSNWNSDQKVVAVTPFVLSGGEAFPNFSFLKSDGSLTDSGVALKNRSKTKGQPHSGRSTTSTARGDNSHLTGNLARSYRAVQSLRKLENIFRVILGLPVKSLATLGDQDLVLELAQSPAQWEKGLGGREQLDGIDGMLFIFPEYHIPVFWMKDTHVPLDMIWIKDTTIVEITPNVPVATTDVLPTYSPNTPVDRVLEVPAGWCDQNQVKVGDQLALTN